MYLFNEYCFCCRIKLVEASNRNVYLYEIKILLESTDSNKKELGKNFILSCNTCFPIQYFIYLYFIFAFRMCGRGIRKHKIEEGRNQVTRIHGVASRLLRGLIRFSSTVSNVVPRPRHRGNPWLSQEKGTLGGRAGLPFVFRAALSIICK